MPDIKVLHLIKSLGRGGAETLLPETLKLHNKKNFEFHYIYFLPWKNQMVEAIESAGGKVTCFPASNNIQLFLQYSAVIEYCKKNKINIIHSHLPWSGFLGRVLHAKTKIPVIYTEHNIQERYHFLTKIINRLTFNYQTLALGVSQDVSRSIRENIKPKIPVVTLLNGVNTEKFTNSIEKGLIIRRTYGIPEDAVVVGNIAVFREQKKIPDWLKAFQLISKSSPNVFGILVGAGPKEEEVKNLVVEMGLTEKVKLVGLQTDTVSYFSAMDIFLMSSAFEGLPIALLEAMSTGCAIVSTKAGGVVEVVKENIDGFLCEVGDYECLANKTLSLVNNSLMRKEFQLSARERIKSSFSLTTMVNKLEDNYAALSEGGKIF